MPCYDERNSPSYVAAEVREDCRHNSEPAELLCYVMTYMPKATQVTLTMGNDKLYKWWAEHVIRDKQKAEAEAKQAAEKKKRAAYERELLQLQKKHGIK